MSKTARTPYRRKKRQKQKRKDVRASRTVKSNASDAAGAMSSSEQTVVFSRLWNVGSDGDEVISAGNVSSWQKILPQVSVMRHTRPATGTMAFITVRKLGTLSSQANRGSEGRKLSTGEGRAHTAASRPDLAGTHALFGCSRGGRCKFSTALSI